MDITLGQLLTRKWCALPSASQSRFNNKSKFKRFQSSKWRRDKAQADTSAEPVPRDRSQSSGSRDDSNKTQASISHGPTTNAHSTSQFNVNSSSRGLSPSSDRNPKTLGLHVLHQPRQPAPLDIIFVHGLGGDSRKTWSKNHDPSSFWPELWLPHELDIGNARIFTFGYNASFRPGTPRSISNISDFAKELLFEMSFGINEKGDDLGLGQVPIIFVVHSMGGLVVKKAYLLGQNDEQYQDIFRSISGIVFLATPHRGTNLAEVLNRVLKVSFQSTKNFIMDLNKSSPALEEVNEQFRHVAPRLSIVSFYETLPTTIGPMKLMVVEKDSSILGYPKEVSRPLNANHHDVCKYSGPDDSNYVSVRNALKFLVKRFQSIGADLVSNRTSKETKMIEKLFAVYSSPEDDLNSFRRRWMPGTCNWVLREPEIQLWLEDTPDTGTRVVWLNAPPGTGKSMLSAHVISCLGDMGKVCQFFFFRFGDQTKRSLSALLRSIAYQVARDIPVFRNILIELSAEGLTLEKADPMTIWHKIFESILFKIELSRPLYWVIDALDESESPRVLVDLLRSLPGSQIALRILILSRKTEHLFTAFERLASFVPVGLIERDGHDHNLDDIQMFVDKEIKHMRGSDELKAQVMQRILTDSKGSFLWVRLVLEEILDCHTEESVRETLNEIPSDMNKLYQRMEMAIVTSPRRSNKLLAKSILQWTICAQRSLGLKELSQALKPEFSELLDIRRTIQDVCGQFILIDPTGKVGMLHQTACDYLTKMSTSEIAINLRRAHEQLFLKSISVLLDPALRLKLTQGQHALQGTEPLVFYAAISWPYHLRHTDATSADVLSMLIKFLSTPSVLTWIHSLALIDQLEILVKAAKALSTFVSINRKLNATKTPMLHLLSALELLDQWATDLAKVVGKFSRYLHSDPSAIYKLVPPFCPENSVLHRQFHQLESAEVLVSGISNYTWSDNLARIALPNGDQALKIACASQYIAVLDSVGNIFVWNSYSFGEICTLRQGEPVTAICFNNRGDKLVSCGLRFTKCWSVPLGQLLSTTSNPNNAKAMTIIFAENDTKILTGSDDRKIRYLRTSDFNVGWHVLSAKLLRESSSMEGTVIGSPMCIAFNGDATQVGVSYRGFPLSVWTLNSSQCIGRCMRAKGFPKDHARPSTSWFAVDRFTWNHVSGHIIGLYRDGCIFKWHPVTNENVEVQSAADEVAASSDGKLFVTSNSDGTVRVWDFEYFSVIYQLSSTDLVAGLAFSPDCRRFYDLRGCSVNAWESNTLVRFSETNDSFGDTASEMELSTYVSQASEANLVQYEAVSALAVALNGSIYCVGNEDGMVELVQVHTGKRRELTTFANFLSVTHLAWSDDARHAAAANLSGGIVVKSLTMPSHGGLEKDIEIRSLPSPKVILEGRGIHQLLFSHDSKLLLITSEDRGQVWAVEDGVLKVSTTLEHGTARCWLKHPTQKHLFIGIGPSDVRVFQWHDFALQHCFHFQEDPRLDSSIDFFPSNDQVLNLAPLSLNPNSGSESGLAVTKAMLTMGSKQVLVHIRNDSTRGTKTTRLLIFDVSALELNDRERAAAPSTYSYVPPEIEARVEFPLGIIAGSRLVFLDQDLWICTFRLGSIYEDEAMKRHYFIPRDWVTTESLEQCCMMDDGTVFCVKDNEVAIIRSNLVSEF